jgi:hypothetical protein
MAHKPVRIAIQKFWYLGVQITTSIFQAKFIYLLFI